VAWCECAACAARAASSAQESKEQQRRQRAADAHGSGMAVRYRGAQRMLAQYFAR